MQVQCAKAASRVKGSYFSAQYQRIAARHGKNRATMVVSTPGSSLSTMF